MGILRPLETDPGGGGSSARSGLPFWPAHSAAALSGKASSCHAFLCANLFTQRAVSPLGVGLWGVFCFVSGRKAYLKKAQKLNYSEGQQGMESSSFWHQPTHWHSECWVSRLREALMSSLTARWLEVAKLLASRISYYVSHSGKSDSILKVPFLCFLFCYLNAPSPGSLKRGTFSVWGRRILPASGSGRR